MCKVDITNRFTHSNFIFAATQYYNASNVNTIFKKKFGGAERSYSFNGKFVASLVGHGLSVLF